MLYPLFEKHKHQWEIFYWVLNGLITGIVNSLSVLDDYQRRGLIVDVSLPFVWELSSQVSLLILLPLLLWVDNKRPIDFSNLKHSIAFHIPLSMFFSFLHVILMVGIRKIYYAFGQNSYDFGDLPTELIYEYRKDVFTYITIFVTIYAYRFVISRLRSEAMEINAGEDTPAPVFVERLIVKKISKEFIIKVSDIEWVEAAGNYMNLHIEQRCYPIRATMAGLEGRLDPKTFARIHRSYLVNLDFVAQITPLETGDFEITLKNDKKLKLSRRYRDHIKAMLAG